MNAHLWVGMPIIRNIVVAATHDPEELEAICRAGDITLADLEDAGRKLSLEQNCAIMDAALRISGDPCLGLHVGERTTPTVLGLTGHIMESSKDVITALRNVQQFTRAFTQLYDFRVEESGEEVGYCCEPLPVWDDISPETARHSVDIAFAGLLHILRLLTGHHFRPLRAEYRYGRIADLTEHERVLHCRPEFGRARTAIVFSRADTDRPIIGYDRELNETLKTLLDQKMRQSAQGMDLRGRVRETIMRNLQFTFPTLEDIAEHMHLTARTLQRKLADEGTSFREVSDTIKEELARNLLNNPNLSLGEIAGKLGYSEATSFQRAFRQWTGLTPTEFRKQAG